MCGQACYAASRAGGLCTAERATPATSVSTQTPRQIPRHIAIVMDGNGRWAKARHRPRNFGHNAGRKAVRAVMEACLQEGVEVLTLFAFSSENWQRPKEEVGALMGLFVRALDMEVEELSGHGVRLCFVGELDAFDESLGKRMRAAMQATAGNTRLKVNVAVNYGGRWDITRACRQAVQAVASGELSLGDIDETRLGGWMTLADGPAVDLLIRTGGELRLSNFLLWQAAYAELYFTNTLWPDFNQASLHQAIEDYAQRERRYGRTSTQVNQSP